MYEKNFNGENRNNKRESRVSAEPKQVIVEREIAPHTNGCDVASKTIEFGAIKDALGSVLKVIKDLDLEVEAECKNLEISEHGGCRITGGTFKLRKKNKKK